MELEVAMADSLHSTQTPMSGATSGGREVDVESSVHETLQLVGLSPMY